jgi:predicted MFS family arabinose efflux permease
MEVMERERTDWTAVSFGVLVGCFAAYQQFKLPPVLPVLLRSYGYDRTVAGGLMSVYALAGLLLSIPLGRLIDRGGLRRLLELALAGMAAGSLLMLAWPQSPALALLARLLEGSAFAVCAIAAPMLATRAAAPRHLGLVIGLVSAWIPVGQLVASGLASAMLASIGWRGLWLAGLLMTLAMALWTAAIGRAQLSPAAARAGRRGTAALTGRELLLLAMGAAIFLLWSGQYFAYMTWLPQYLVEVLGISAQAAAVGYAVPVATLLGFNLLTGMALRAGMAVGPLLVAALASQAAVWWTIPLAGNGWGGLASLIFYGIGAGIAPTCLFAVPPAIVGGGRSSGQVFAILMTGRNIGVLLGPVLLAEISKRADGWSLSVPVFGAASTLAAAIGLALAWRLGRRPG